MNIFASIIFLCPVSSKQPINAEFIGPILISWWIYKFTGGIHYFMFYFILKLSDNIVVIHTDIIRSWLSFDFWYKCFYWQNCLYFYMKLKLVSTLIQRLCRIQCQSPNSIIRGWTSALHSFYNAGLDIKVTPTPPSVNRTSIVYYMKQKTWIQISCYLIKIISALVY